MFIVSFKRRMVDPRTYPRGMYSKIFPVDEMVDPRTYVLYSSYVFPVNEWLIHECIQNDCPVDEWLTHEGIKISIVGRWGAKGSARKVFQQIPPAVYDSFKKKKKNASPKKSKTCTRAKNIRNPQVPNHIYKNMTSTDHRPIMLNGSLFLFGVFHVLRSFAQNNTMRQPPPPLSNKKL